MDTSIARDLMELIFQAPGVNGILVFEDYDYLGVIFKRDIEIGITEGKFKLFENINFIKQNQLDEILFKNDRSKTIKIPVVDKTGKLIRVLSYDEYLCHFNFSEFGDHFKLSNVINNLDYPVFITNHFRKILYANKKGLELAEQDAIGKNMNSILKRFELKMINDELETQKSGRKYRLVINSSITPIFSYRVYEFYNKNHEENHV